MIIDDVRKTMIEKNNDLSDTSIHTGEINTVAEVDQWIELLSTESLKINGIRITLNPIVADYFITKFIGMENKPQLKRLELPKIKLLHFVWQNFFAGLNAFTELEFLGLEHSNFDYELDLDYLGAYLKDNPSLRQIDLICEQTILKPIVVHPSGLSMQVPPDPIFKSGKHAKKLCDYLQTNKHLMEFKYGAIFDSISKTILSPEIQQILDANGQAIQRSHAIMNAVHSLKNEYHLNGIINRFQVYLQQSIKNLKDNHQAIELGSNGQPVCLNLMFVPLKEICNLFELAKECKEFNESALKDKLHNQIKYFGTQHALLSKLYKLRGLESEASDHDKVVLQSLRQDILNSWNKAVAIEDSSLRNKEMEVVIKNMIAGCQTAKSKVNDKTSSALIKNIILILGSLLTLGIALGIYAAVTKESRAARGSFFYKDVEISSPAITEVENKLKDFAEDSEKYYADLLAH
ncbi:hypothetical protein [Legionella worsleiensis]|uniref:Uncharacterized protein n=1 Tax=Legionella worsleiensis TaxID=45076 RepID=A0A0W1AFX9_9GAMM|nr:hypothetical protein [Legionella worsleiensis]KTD80217.1 hypothetical protein Lwor_1125 [Legionella worsleiensis]STY31716.1 Uncharacterised protein [Legionella worsleiensis]